MIRRTRETMPAVYLVGIEERRESHAGCPLCGGRKQVATVINGVVCARACQFYGCGGRAMQPSRFWCAFKARSVAAGGTP